MKYIGIQDELGVFSIQAKLYKLTAPESIIRIAKTPFNEGANA